MHARQRDVHPALAATRRRCSARQPHAARPLARRRGGRASPDSRTWTIAARPQPTPMPTATPDPTPDPARPDGDTHGRARRRSSPRPRRRRSWPRAAPADRRLARVLHERQAALHALRHALGQGRPRRRDDQGHLHGRLPAQGQTLTSAKGGTVKLAGWLRKRLKTGATLTITVTKPGMAGMAKALTMRAERRPRIVTQVAAAEGAHAPGASSRASVQAARPRTANPGGPRCPSQKIGPPSTSSASTRSAPCPWTRCRRPTPVIPERRWRSRRSRTCSTRG